MINALSYLRLSVNLFADYVEIFVPKLKSPLPTLAQCDAPLPTMT